MRQFWANECGAVETDPLASAEQVVNCVGVISGMATCPQALAHVVN
jgi:hypothetical protein